MRSGVTKVPSYLVDMVMLKNKILIIKSGDISVAQFTKETVQESIVLVEATEYDGRLFKKDIKYHLIHINTEKADCKEIAN